MPVDSIENHPADSWVDIDESGKVQTLTSRMGIGGGNVPMVLEQKAYGISSYESNAMKSANPHSGIYEADTARTLDLNGGNPACNQGGIAIAEAVAFTQNQREEVRSLGNLAGALAAERGTHQQTFVAEKIVLDGEPAVAYGTDVGFFNSIKEQSPTLLARSYKYPHLVTYPKDSVRYIVRRLTPTECARLQGFPDKWGHPEWISEDACGDVPEFWREVYLADCTIKNKKPKPRIADKQNGWETTVLRWYNGLHTDSAEYKMWGNGIALPPAYFCMQGMAEELKKEEHND